MSKELEALEYLKNRITTLSLNHKIGSRDIAKIEVKDIVRGIETHVIPILENAITELERLKKFKETFDNYELAKKQDFIAYENWLECEAELKKSPTAEGACDKKLELYRKFYRILTKDSLTVVDMKKAMQLEQQIKEIEDEKYKTYFDKQDTPYIQEFQFRKKHHIVWKRLPYKTFLNHAVVKIKLWGLFTIYSPSEEELTKVRQKIQEIKEKKNDKERTK